MKQPAFILLSLVATLITGHADPGQQDAPTRLSEQAKVALTHLKRLGSGKIDLTKDTALSENCSAARRATIRDQISFLRKNYFRDGDSFTVEEQKTDRNFAAVLIRSENTATPLGTRVHAIAIIKKGDAWKAAPLPGTFANTGYGYDPAVEQTVRQLERWMAREKNLRETKHQQEASNKIKESLEKIEQQSGLTSIEPGQAVLRLIQHCREKNLLAAITLLGGASDALEDPLETTINQVSEGFRIKQTDNEWFLVTSRSVIAEVLKIDKARNEVAVGFYNSLERGKPQVLYFPLHKAGGKTFVRLSPMLKIATLPENERWQQRWQLRRGDEEELGKQLPAAIFKNLKPTRHANSQELLTTFLAAVDKNDFKACLGMTPRKGGKKDYFAKAENRSAILFNLGSLWRDLQRLKSSPRETFDIIEQGNIALAPLQFARTNKTGEFVTLKIWMIKDESGWHLVSQQTLDKALDGELSLTAGKIEKRFLDQEKRRQEQQARSLLDKVVTITPPLSKDKVSSEQAKRIFSEFRSHLRSKNTQGALSSCAVLKGTNSTQTLKTFNYALRGAADHTNYDHVFGITQRGKWTGVSVRTESKLVGLHDYPLYLIVNTELGARVLLDIDLRNPTNRGRELINKKNWRKLEAILPKESLDEVKSIYQTHLKLTAKDVEEQLKLRE